MKKHHFKNSKKMKAFHLLLGHSTSLQASTFVPATTLYHFCLLAKMGTMAVSGSPSAFTAIPSV